MGAARKIHTSEKDKKPKKPKDHRLMEVDFDSNHVERQKLLMIIKEEARNLEAFEVAWFLSRSLSNVYAEVPRVKSSRGPVRFDPAVIKLLKTGSQDPLGRSVTIEKKAKSVGLPSVLKKNRKVKAILCL